MAQKAPAKFDASIPLDPAPQKFGDDLPIDSGDGTTSTPPSTGNVTPPTDRQRFLNPELYPVGAPGEGVGTNLKNLAQRGGVGIFQLANAVAHPIQTFGSMVSSVAPEPVLNTLNTAQQLRFPGSTPIFHPNTPNPVEQGYKAVQPGGWQAAANVAPVAGQALAGGALAEAGPAMLGDMGALARKGAAILSDTTPKVLTRKGGIVPEAQAANAVAKEVAAKSDLDNAQSHLSDTQAALDEAKGRELAYNQSLQAKADQISAKDTTEATGQQADYAQQVKDTQAKNAATTQKAEADFAKAQQDFFQKQAQHQQKAAATLTQNQKLLADHQKAVTDQQTLQNQLNENEQGAKVDLKKVEQRVHGEANQLYEDLKPQLEKIEADPETVAEIHDDANDLVDFAGGAPPLLEKLKNALKGGNSLTYGDLDAFRSAIGRQMSKGNLPGNTYYIYQRMLEGDPASGTTGIIDEMQRIADDQGLTDQANQARASWRTWAESFRDRSSPLRNIISDPEAHGLLKSMRGQQSYLDRLRAFGPDGDDLADRIQNDLNSAQQGKAQFTTYGHIKIPEPKSPTLGAVADFAQPAPQFNAPVQTPVPSAPQSLLASGSPMERAAQSVKMPERPNFPDRPAPAPVDLQSIAPADIQTAKAGALANRANSIRTKGGGFATTIVALDAIRHVIGAFRGDIAANLGDIGLDIGARVAYGAGKGAIANLLEKPEVIQFLTKPRPQDVAMIPPELARDMGPVLDEAKRQGIKISPAVTAAIAGAAPTKWYNDQNQ